MAVLLLAIALHHAGEVEDMVVVAVEAMAAVAAEEEAKKFHSWFETWVKTHNTFYS